jgi:hypothetical protein
LPTEASILGFENRWQAEAYSEAVIPTLPSGQEIRAIPPQFLLATKLGAEVADAAPPLRDYIADQLRKLSQHPRFDNGAEGALAAGPETRERFELVVRPRIEALALAGS